MKKVKIQMLTRKLKKEQHALKPKHKLKAVVDVVVAETAVARVATVAVVKVADNAVVAHKVVETPVVVALVVEGDNMAM
jgi:hypothetical protein